MSQNGMLNLGRLLLFFTLVAILYWGTATLGERRLRNIAERLSVEMSAQSSGISVRTAGMTLILEGTVSSESDRVKVQWLAQAHLSGYHPSEHIRSPHLLNLIQIKQPMLLAAQGAAQGRSAPLLRENRSNPASRRPASVKSQK